ncbi:MAG: hypothetical protein IH606_16600 [Burkholderiales bacterium]|nr:hypothetical protein [Burkholderiales bacterium]
MKTLEDKSGKPLSRKDEFAQKVKAFRQATGKPERFTIACACAEHDRGFTVTYERMGVGEKWRIGSIAKDVGQEKPRSLFGGAKPRLLEVSMGEVDNSKWICPWCQNTRGYIHCAECNTIVCGARRREEGGERYFRCRDSCGCDSGPLVSLESLAGADAPSLSPPGKPARLLPGSTPRPSLRGGSSPALGKPKR